MCGGRINPFCCPGWQQGPSVGLCIVRKYFYSFRGIIVCRKFSQTNKTFFCTLLSDSDEFFFSLFKFYFSPIGYICNLEYESLLSFCESRRMFPLVNISPRDIRSLYTRPGFHFLWFNLKQISIVLFCKITLSHLVIQFDLNSIKTAITVVLCATLRVPGLIVPQFGLSGRRVIRSAVKFTLVLFANSRHLDFFFLFEMRGS